MYKVIYDEKQVKKFQDKYFNKDDIYLTYMSARKKYEPALSSKNGCMNRKTISGKSSLIKNLKHYEISQECYYDYDKSLVIPPHSLVTYCSVNSRDVKKACNDMATSIISIAFDGRVPNIKDGKLNTYLQKHSIKKYIGIDFDDKDEKTFENLIDDLKSKIPEFDIIETKGGYHIIFHKKYLSGEAGKYVYKDLKKKYPKIDTISNDLFSPIPGTLQGEFEVKFVTQM